MNLKEILNLEDFDASVKHLVSYSLLVHTHAYSSTVDDLTHYFITNDGFETLFFDDVNDLHDDIYFLWRDLVGLDTSVFVDDHPRHVSIHVLLHYCFHIRFLLTFSDTRQTDYTAWTAQTKCMDAALGVLDEAVGNEREDGN